MCTYAQPTPSLPTLRSGISAMLCILNYILCHYIIYMDVCTAYSPAAAQSRLVVSARQAGHGPRHDSIMITAAADEHRDRIVTVTTTVTALVAGHGPGPPGAGLGLG